jgi:hypothetical protein
MLSMSDGAGIVSLRDTLGQLSFGEQDSDWLERRGSTVALYPFPNIFSSGASQHHS